MVVTNNRYRGQSRHKKARYKTGLLIQLRAAALTSSYRWPIESVTRPWISHTKLLESVHGIGNGLEQRRSFGT
jgi:hypothetical protein